METTSRSMQIGPDRVTINGDTVTIEARREMADWQVREFNLIPIYFEDKKYFLVEKSKAQPPHIVRYVLKPWPDGQVASGKRFHTYDAEAVAERDSAHRTGMRDEVVHAILLPLYPFLGCLWSRMQERLVRFGFVPRSLTGISIFCSFCLGFCQAVFAVIMLNASARSGKMMIGGFVRAVAGGDQLHVGPVAIPIVLLDGLVLVTLMADSLMRYSHYLRDNEWTGGFLEWLVSGFLRRNRTRTEET